MLSDLWLVPLTLIFLCLFVNYVEILWGLYTPIIYKNQKSRRSKSLWIFKIMQPEENSQQQINSTFLRHPSVHTLLFGYRWKQTIFEIAFLFLCQTLSFLSVSEPSITPSWAKNEGSELRHQFSLHAKFSLNKFSKKHSGNN